MIEAKEPPRSSHEIVKSRQCPRRVSNPQPATRSAARSNSYRYHENGRPSLLSKDRKPPDRSHLLLSLRRGGCALRVVHHESSPMHRLLHGDRQTNLHAARSARRTHHLPQTSIAP